MAAHCPTLMIRLSAAMLSSGKEKASGGRSSQEGRDALPPEGADAVVAAAARLLARQTQRQQSSSVFDVESKGWTADAQQATGMMIVEALAAAARAGHERASGGEEEASGGGRPMVTTAARTAQHCSAPHSLRQRASSTGRCSAGDGNGAAVQQRAVISTHRCVALVVERRRLRFRCVVQAAVHWTSWAAVHWTAGCRVHTLHKGERTKQGGGAAAARRGQSRSSLRGCFSAQRRSSARCSAGRQSDDCSEELRRSC